MLRAEGPAGPGTERETLTGGTSQAVETAHGTYKYVLDGEMYYIEEGKI
jgi:hypothetical protein